MPLKDRVFEQTLTPHLDRLYRLAWRLCGSRSEAEDLFQEALLKAYLDLDRLVDIEAPGAWLARSMYHLFIDQQRRFKKQRLATVGEGALPGDGLDAFAGDLDPEADRSRYDNRLRLAAALDRLSEDQRLVVLLFEVEGYKLSEIQEITDAPTGTLKSRLSRARERLKEILSDDGTFSG